MEDLIINPSTMKLEVDIMDIPTSNVIVICDGKAKLRELSTHGEYKIVNIKGKLNGCEGKKGKSFEKVELD